MRLSRINRHKRSQKRYKTKITNSNRNNSPYNSIKKAILISTLTYSVFITQSVAYADSTISVYLKNWYLDRLHEIEQHLTTSIENEAMTQKAMVLKGVRVNAEESVKELQEYASSQKAAIDLQVQEKAKETVEIIKAKNKEDIASTKEQVKDELKADAADAQQDKNAGEEVKDEEPKQPDTPDIIEETEPPPSPLSDIPEESPVVEGNNSLENSE